MKIKFYILILIFSIISLPICTQVQNGDLLTNLPLDLIRINADDVNSNDYGSLQTADNNLARIARENYQSNNYNKALLIQEGDQNMIYIIQNTDISIINATQQGFENNLSLIFEGRDINMNTNQLGNFNTIDSKISQSSDVNIDLTQVGNNNNLVQRIFNINTLEMQILQRGNESDLIIIQN